LSEPVQVTCAELRSAYHDLPPRTIVENGRQRSYHDGVEAVARLVAERAGIDLVIDREQPHVTVTPTERK
jgi:hypothetical protein